MKFNEIMHLSFYTDQMDELEKRPHQRHWRISWEDTERKC